VSRPYSTPPGTYDMPFTWCYDASALTDGTAYPNQYVYLQGGYGDFILRRIVGLSRILDPTTGQYQIRDNYNNYIEQAPLFGVSADDIGLAPELRYQELGAIKFDLGTILRPSLQPLTSQIAFQGARRMKGAWAKRPGYKADPKTFTYILPATISGLAGASTPVRVSQTMDNYDFELYNIILTQQNNASLYLQQPDASAILIFVAVASGPSAITIDVENTGAPNLPNSVTVVGSAITVQGATDALGNPSPAQSGNAILALYNANPAALALASLSVQLGINTLPTTFGPVPLGPASAGKAITTPISSLWLYDSNKVQTSNAPVLDIFMDGGQQATFNTPSMTPYGNGCVSPPLFYPKETVINVDVYSQVTDPTLLPVGLLIHLVGRKYYPC
jgi:hypothetical protein